jgi:hypothetical protein
MKDVNEQQVVERAIKQIQQGAFLVVQAKERKKPDDDWVGPVRLRLEKINDDGCGPEKPFYPYSDRGCG